MNEETKNTIFQFPKDALAQAVTQYSAGRLGIEEEVSPEEAGRRGAFAYQIAKTGAKFINGEITKEEAKEEIEEATVSYIVSKTPIIDKAIDRLAEFVEEKIPSVEPVVEAVKPLVKTAAEFVVKKVVKKTFSWIKNKIFGS